MQNIVYTVNSIIYAIYDVTLSPEYVALHQVQVPDIPLLCPATLTWTIFLLLLPTYLVLYNTIDFDVALASLTTATVTSAVVDMIMSLVIIHENKKLILRALNIVHEVEFNADGKSCSHSSYLVTRYNQTFMSLQVMPVWRWTGPRPARTQVNIPTLYFLLATRHSFRRGRKIGESS